MRVIDYLINELKNKYDFIVVEDKDILDNSCGYFQHIYCSMYCYNKTIINMIERATKKLQSDNINIEFHNFDNETIKNYIKFEFDIYFINDLITDKENKDIILFFKDFYYLLKSNTIKTEFELLNK